MNIIVDGNYLLSKSYYIFMNKEGGELLFQTNEREAQNQLMRKFMTDLCSCLCRVQNELQEVVVVFDGHNYWRRQLFDFYKANRDGHKPVQIFYNVIDDSVDLLKHYGFTVLRVNELEGDDLIFLESRELIQKDFTLVITGDMDISQILSQDLVIWNGKGSGSKVFILSKDQIGKLKLQNVDTEYLEVDPYFTIFSKLLLGDSGDNIPRTLPRGKGEKFVESLYKRFAYIKKDQFELTTDFYEKFQSFLESENLRDVSLEDNIILVCFHRDFYSNELYSQFEEQSLYFTQLKGKSLNMRSILFNTIYLS